MSFGNHAINLTENVRLTNHNRSLKAAIAVGAHQLIDVIYSLFFIEKSTNITKDSLYTVHVRPVLKYMFAT